jgi:type II secretory pathway pseudopilin PulG
MSTMVKEKKPFLPQRKSSAPAGGIGTSVALASAGSAVAGHVVVGGEPRVHLLPSDVVGRKKSKALRRRMLTLLVLVLIVVAGAYGAVTLSLASAQSALQTAQARTAVLLQQQAKYGQIVKVKSDIGSIQTNQKTATAQEILWQPFVKNLGATLPADAIITVFTGSIDSPFASSADAAIPLQGPHIATVDVTVLMTQGEIAPWLDALPKLKGFVDAVPDSVTSTNDTTYTVVVTLHLNEKALSGRFAKTAEVVK